MSRRKDVDDPLQMVPAAMRVLMGETDAPQTKSKSKSKAKLNGEPEPEAQASSSSPFELRSNGVYFIDPDSDKGATLVCGRLEITAVTRSAESDHWGRLLEWCDHDGKPHRWPMPMALLAGDGSAYRQHLLDGGLYLAPGLKARERLALYIQMQSVQSRVTCVDRIGWHHDGGFVFPDSSLGQSGAEPLIYQTESEAEPRLETQGTAQEWREHVGALCSGNRILVLAVSCAFAGPLLEPAHMENGGIHLISESSKGKSTALIVAGSVLGGGDSKYGYANTWKATANGLEAVAEAHNDLCLMLDEIQMVDPKEAADVAYMLANGQGKVRMTRSIGLRKRKGWRLLFLSSGELTLADHSASVGKRTRGGAEVRLLNIPADMGQGLGVLETLHGRETSEQFIDEIGAAAKRYYGAPIRAFIKAVIENREEVITALNAARQYMRQQVPKSASGEVFRAAARLAVVAAAGEYATHLGLTGWTKGEATAAAVSALKAWIEARGSTGHADEETALRQVRHFIEANGASRFEGIAQRFDKDGNEIRERIPNRAGYRGEHDGKAEFWILPEVWHKEVCAGLNSANVARWLHEKGYLRREDLKHLTCRENVPDVTKRIRVYCVKTEVLLGE